jgi:hypothetical protein
MKSRIMKVKNWQFSTKPDFWKLPFLEAILPKWVLPTAY